MKLLHEPKEINLTLSSMLKKYKNYYILTAWASGEHSTFNSLVKNKNNIQQMVVGTQFYQTNPNFIKKTCVISPPTSKNTPLSFLPSIITDIPSDK